MKHPMAQSQPKCIMAAHPTWGCSYLRHATKGCSGCMCRFVGWKPYSPRHLQRGIQRSNSRPKRLPTACPTCAPADLYAQGVQPTRVPITAFQVGSCHNRHIQAYLRFMGSSMGRSKLTFQTLAAAGRDLALGGGTAHPAVGADGWDSRLKPYQ